MKAFWQARITLCGLPLSLLCAACSYRVPFGDDRARHADAAPPDEPTPNAMLSEVPANTALDLGPMKCADLPGSGYPCQQIVDWSTFVYDRSRHRLLLFGGGDHGTARSDVAVFDFASLSWSSAYAPTACSEMVRSNVDWNAGAWLSSGQPFARQTDDLLVMTESPAELLLLTYSVPGDDCVNWPAARAELEAIAGRIGHYDPDLRRWRFVAESPQIWGPGAAAELDPVSQRVVVI